MADENIIKAVASIFHRYEILKEDGLISQSEAYNKKTGAFAVLQEYCEITEKSFDTLYDLAYNELKKLREAEEG